MPESQNFFFIFYFALIYFTVYSGGGVQWFDYRENYTFPRIQGFYQFPGGVQLFPGGGGEGGGPNHKI